MEIPEGTPTPHAFKTETHRTIAAFAIPTCRYSQQRVCSSACDNSDSASRENLEFPRSQFSTTPLLETWRNECRAHVTNSDAYLASEL